MLVGFNLGLIRCARFFGGCVFEEGKPTTWIIRPYPRISPEVITNAGFFVFVIFGRKHLGTDHGDIRYVAFDRCRGVLRTIIECVGAEYQLRHVRSANLEEILERYRSNSHHRISISLL